MAKNMFLIPGNICGERVRLGRAMHNLRPYQRRVSSICKRETLNRNAAVYHVANNHNDLGFAQVIVVG